MDSEERERYDINKYEESTTNSSEQPTRDIRQIFEELEDPDYKQKKLNEKA